MNRRGFLQVLAGVPLAAQPARRNRHVVIISIDGFAAFALRDPNVAVPNLRRLARAGASADAMETVNPTVTWPNHTSLITGVGPARHQVLYNGLPVRPGPGQPLRVEPWVDKPQLVRAPTLYDAAHAAGLSTAEVDWVAIHNAKTITHAFPEIPRLTDPVVREMMAAGLITEAQVTAFGKGPITWRDEVWTLAGEHIIEKHRPHLLLFHLLTTDSAQHRYGAGSLAGAAALSLADARVGRLLAALDRAGIRRNTTVIVVSDHGFKTYRRRIHANALLLREGLLREEAGSYNGDAWVIPEGGTAMVYVTRPERAAETVSRLRALFSRLEGVSRVIEPAGFAALGYPPPGGRMADLVLAAAEGYSFDGNPKSAALAAEPDGSTPGAHGYLNNDAAMDAIFIASGAGIRAGATLPRVRNVDVAPTAARLLGLEMKDVEGRVLTEILA